MVLKYWNYWILIFLIIIFTYVYISRKTDFFEDSYPGYNVTMKYQNDSLNIRDRHPVYSSLVQDLNHKFKKAYNYELENNEYQDAINNTFHLDKKILVDMSKYTQEEPLNRVLPSNVEDAYNNAINNINDTIKNSVHFDLPDGSLQLINPIQVVHDRLISYQTHKTIPNNYILHIESILYREGKYHGKHVEFIVIIEKNKMWESKVIDAKVIGVVFEDKISLFPVIGNDELTTNEDLSPAVFPDQQFTK